MMLHNPFSAGLAYYSKSIIRSKYSCLKLHKRQKHSKLLSICSGSRTCWNNRYVILTPFVPSMWSADCVYIYCRKFFCFLYFCLCSRTFKMEDSFTGYLSLCHKGEPRTRQLHNTPDQPGHKKSQPRKIGSIRFIKNPTSEIACPNVCTGHCKIQSKTQKI